MRRIILLVFALGGCLLPLAWTQAPTAGPAPELQKWTSGSGTGRWQGPAKDAPTEPEYKVDLKMRGRWILGGHFWRSVVLGKARAWSRPRWRLLLRSGPEINAVSGFDSDGGTWVLTATFTPGTSIETGTQTAPDGKTSTFEYVDCKRRWNVHLGKTRGGADGVRWTGFTVKGTKTKPPSGNSRTLEAAYKQSKEPCYENTRRLIVVACFAGVVFAQQPNQPPKPGPELQKLQLWVGEWTYEAKAQPPSSAPAKNSLAE